MSNHAMSNHAMSIEEAVRTTVASYTHRVDTGRIDELLDLFLPDAIVEIVGAARYEGIQAIGTMFGRGVEHLAQSADVARIRHHLASQLIEIDSDSEARSSCYWTAIVGDLGVDHWGRYVDRLELVDDRWRFRQRRIYLDGAVPGGWGARGAEWNR
jgi:hypothetical protein